MNKACQAHGGRDTTLLALAGIIAAIVVIALVCSLVFGNGILFDYCCQANLILIGIVIAFFIFLFLWVAIGSIGISIFGE